MPVSAQSFNAFINLRSSYAVYMLALHVVLQVSRKGIPVHSSQRKTQCRGNSREESARKAQVGIVSGLQGREGGSRAEEG